ncbi:MAG: hypothetical protein ACYSTT_10775, partial [Planctomycetota bacterium]
MKTKQLFTAVLAGVMLAGLTATAGAKAPKMKMTTPIPEEITTPDKMKTSIGTLRFKNGMPDKATIDKAYDYIDLARAVNVFMDTQSGVSMWAFRKGMRDAGVPDNTLMSAEKLTDSTGMYL